MLRERVCRAVVAIGGVAFLLLWFWDPAFSEDETVQQLIKSVVSHFLGSIVFVALFFFLRYRLCAGFRFANLAVLLPALLIVVNNLPILALITGSAHLDRVSLVPLFALDSLLIGVFEEFAFRGTLFLAILEKHRKTGKQIILTTVITSAVFGLVHFANLLEGAGIIPTLMQVAYSFLIGGMCSIVLLKTGNLIYCILLHAIYDFCGNLLPTLGSGSWWDTPTVILTVILSVLVGIWMLMILFRSKPEETERFYFKKERVHLNHEHDSN